MVMTNSSGVISPDVSGALGLDFSRTFYGMENPILCESRYMEVLSEFEDADDAPSNSSADNSRSSIAIELLISSFYSQLKKGSKKRAMHIYSRLVDEIVREASEDSACTAGEEQLKAAAKTVIEEQLGIDIDKEFQNCRNTAPKADFAAVQPAAAKKASRQQLYISKPKAGSYSSSAAKSSYRTSYSSGKKSFAPSIYISGDITSKCADIWETAADVLGSPACLGVCFALAWAALIFCQFQQ